MASTSVLVLAKSSTSSPPSAAILATADYEDTQALVKAIKGALEADTSRTKRFLKKNIIFLNPTVSIARLRPIEVPNLTALPPWKALIRHATPNKAFTEAVREPESMDQGFYTHLFHLYDDVFVDIDQEGGRIALPQHALVMQYKMSPTTQRVIGGMVSVLGGLISVAVRAGEGSFN
ncbi:hypothetical protein BDP81DRAFT_450292 [Colletotrichum phormii]|uniref:Uncharacterized protein n=1 Tax=Colletotrichum phormii TaxID=359342 RepID=A0AAJ0EGU2_9PEZI|nr:uncharacterized protein BDP81DRAFT_450292 [Colletotrichum phormii]KAK1636401.1 hypothetical protein BDP81DRAFT_450292 [Colletotrichum phormii]